MSGGTGPDTRILLLNGDESTVQVKSLKGTYAEFPISVCADCQLMTLITALQHHRIGPCFAQVTEIYFAHRISRGFPILSRLRNGAEDFLTLLIQQNKQINLGSKQGELRPFLKISMLVVQQTDFLRIICSSRLLTSQEHKGRQ